MTLSSLGVLAVGLCAASLLVGRGDLADPELAGVFLRLRAWRTGAAFLAGCALGGAGVAVQALFRNPLADPSILGTSAGASFGGQLGMLAFATGQTGGVVIGGLAPEVFLPVGCIAGALAATAVLLLATRGRAGFLVVLLTGFVLSSLFISAGAFLVTLAQESWELGRAMIAFTLGTIGGAGPVRLLLAAPLAAFGLVAVWLWGPSLDVLLSGEEEAASLGIDVAEVRRWSVVWVSMLVAAAVSLGGALGFVGLIAPHAMRPFAGVVTRRLLPAAALAGGCFVVGCDLASRLAPTRGELPLGVVSGLVGAPLFLVLLFGQHRRGQLA